MNSDEYHTFTLDNDGNRNRCPFCGLDYAEHEQACPHNPNTRDDVVFDHLKEPWTETP